MLPHRGNEWSKSKDFFTPLPSDGTNFLCERGSDSFLERLILNNILVWGHEQTDVLGSSYDRTKLVYIENVNDNKQISAVIPSEEYVG